MDHFSLRLAIKEFLDAIEYDPEFHVVGLAQESEALNFAYTTLKPDSTDIDEVPRAVYESLALSNSLATAETHRMFSRTRTIDNERYLSSSFVSSIQSEGRGVVLISGVRDTDKPIELIIVQRSNSKLIAQIELPLRVSEVEDMFRHLNMVDVSGKTGTTSSRLTAPNYPDTLTNG